MDSTEEIKENIIANHNEVQNETSQFCQHISISANQEDEIKIANVIPQIIVSCIIHCIVIQGGINMAYSTVLLSGLELDTEMNITEKEGSWIASLVTITLPIGSLIAGSLMDKFGRKMVCLLSCVPAAISWVLFMFAKSLFTIYAARFLAGISAGLTTVGLIYVSELTHPQVRPMLLCLNSVFISLGILITYCLAVMLHWRQMAIIFFTLECCIFFALLFIPESPYWLACFKNGMFNEKWNCELKRSLRRLNKKQAIYEQEYSRITEVYRNRVINDEAPKTLVESIKNYYHKFTAPNAYKPIVILLILFLLQQFSGAYVIIFYAISIFREMGGTFGEYFNENGALVMLGIVRFVVSILTVFSSRKYGRRIICILSGAGMTVSMFLSGAYIYFTVSYDENGQMIETLVEYKWLLLSFILFYICSSSFGMVNIPWTLIGELLPLSVRGVGGGLMVSFAYIMMFVVVMSYPYVLKHINIEDILISFGFISLIVTIYIYLFLPETLGKSFSDIEKHFSSNRKKEARDIADN